MLHFIRHGETDYNVQRRFAGGDVEVSLTERGREQARRFASDNRDFLQTCDLLIVSPQDRAQETASLILPHCPAGIRCETVESLREWILGDWSGKDYDRTPPLFVEPPPDPPNGETFSTFENRVLSALFEIARRPEENVLVIAHGAVWFAYARRCAHRGQDTKIFLGNCELEKIDRKDLLSSSAPEIHSP